MTALPTRPRAKRSSWQIQKAVLFALFLRELKTRLDGRWLGVLWLFFEPCAMLGLQILMFSAWHQVSLPSIEYPVFLITGMLPYFIFQSVALKLMDAIDANRGLFGYRQVKPIDPLIARAALEVTIKLGVFAICMALMSALFGLHAAPSRPLELLGTLTVLLLLCFGLGLLLAVATARLPKSRVFVRLLSFPLYLISGVMFPLQMVPPAYQEWLLLNPLLHSVELTRSAFFPGYVLHSGISAAYLALWALVVLTVAMALYRVRRERLITVM
ncbi:ABC transporter permease [Roseateles sp. BYS180W]|uniref:Transport permease protein n=1 Tax=Roseateles rivi TaxID=3299028 RepID=A0ABW7FZJ3_9BURK